MMATAGRSTGASTIRFAANLSTMFRERAFPARFSAAAACGFDAVECQFPYEMTPGELKAALDRHALEMVLFNLPPGDWTAGERGIAALPGREAEFAETVSRALDYAGATACGQLHVMAGIVPEGLDRGAAEETFVANLAAAASRAERRGVRLLIEPINPFDMPGYFLTSMDQAATILDRVGAANLFLQYDLYHQSRTRGELLATHERHRARIGHIQFAANPGRHEPDRGEIDYPFVLSEIARAGYAGHFGCEYFPRGRTEDGLGWRESFAREESRGTDAPRPV